jgi:5-methylcytosine-specific restriction endonuclease McrBC regulatory subunit McrC
LQGDKISTGNIMGFVGLGDTQLDIKSRFAQDDCRDYFLHYMLQKVFSINLFDIKHTSNKEQIFDFLLYLFPYHLKKALAQGLFKKYRTFEHNDANLRGVIDVSRHIRQNIPFKGTVAYNTRTHSYDNEITQLIRHTIEFIKTKPSGSVVLNNDLETRQCVSQIVAATPTYKPTLRDKIIGQNLRPVRHPYFGAYTALQNLCIKILRHESIKFGNEKDKVYGILFDGAWLWEEYLATFLKDFTHPRSKTDNIGKKMFCNPHRVLCQPDFFIDGKIVLDAKYKKHETLFDKKQREDRFQLLSYMHVFNASQSGLIVPSNKTGLLEQGEIVNGGTMSLYGLCVNHNTTIFLDYAKAMKHEETAFFNQCNINTIIL